MKLRCLYPDVVWQGETLSEGDIITVESEEEIAAYEHLALFGFFTRVPDEPPSSAKRDHHRHVESEPAAETKTAPMTSHAAPTTVGRRVRR
jgi:hypothetical protein